MKKVPSLDNNSKKIKEFKIKVGTLVTLVKEVTLLTVVTVGEEVKEVTVVIVVTLLTIVTKVTTTKVKNFYFETNNFILQKKY